MSRTRGVLLFLLLALLFFAANRASYQGWFNDDDLDNLIWTTRATNADFVRAFDPRFIGFNFRPAGHLIYRALGLHSGMEFAPFLFVAHGLHLLNCWLLWLVLRRLGANVQGTCAGTLLFALHVACFDAWWKPMFLFDVLATTFALLTFLAWLHDRRLLALVAFYLAFKSKELAVVLPAFLLAYESLCGQRRWRRTLPFFALAAWFTWLGATLNQGQDNAYTLRFTSDAVWTTLNFYSSNILLLPWAGLVLIPAAFFTKDRRIRLGLIAIPILLGPLWFLPGRLFSVYLYLPLIGLAIAFAFAAEKLRPIHLVALFALWLPWNYQLLREQRRSALTVGPENRAYFEQLSDWSRRHPAVRTVVYDGGPTYMNRWGIVAILRWLYPSRDLKYAGLADGDSHALLRQPSLAVIGWDRQHRRLLTAERAPDTPLAALIDMREPAPAWQFIRGWYVVEAGYRWTAPDTALALRRTKEHTRFELQVNLPAQQRGVTAEVQLDGVSLGSREFHTTGTHAQIWPLPDARDGHALVEVRFSPPYRPSATDPRTLGAAVAAIGFRSGTDGTVP